MGVRRNFNSASSRLDAHDEEEERGIDPSKPLLLRAENLETRETGFYSLASYECDGTPRKADDGLRRIIARWGRRRTPTW